jgi:hypothetical protein
MVNQLVTKVVIRRLELPQLQAAAPAVLGIQLLQAAQADLVVVVEIVLATAVALEYPAAQELQVKDFQVDRVYASTMTAKIHTTAVVVVVQAAQDWPRKTKINNKQPTAAQVLPVTLWELYYIGVVVVQAALTFAMAVAVMEESGVVVADLHTMFQDLAQH